MTAVQPSRAPESVIIVDDEVDHAIIIRMIVAELAPRARVDVFTDTRALGDRLAAVPDRSLVLLDRVLGDRQGVDVIEALCRRRPDLTVAMLSAAFSEGDRDHALRAGACEAVTKPGSLDGWRSLLGGLLNRAGEGIAPAGGATV